MSLKRTGLTLVLSLIILFPVLTSGREPEGQHKTHLIEINKFRFKPETLTVDSGDEVRWVNKDIVSHQIADESLKWRSEELLINDGFTFRVDKVTFYICKLHPGMRGKIAIRQYRGRP